jgi:nucleoside-diphosphate-sugar epimerase
MKVFLTGGTGFIGQPLTKSLIDRAWDITVLVRKPESPQARALVEMGAQCVAGDVTDRQSMRAGMIGADLVIHNAAWYEVGVSKNAQKEMEAINVRGTDNVLGMAQELGIPRVVYVSSCVYFGDSGSQVQDETYQRQSPYCLYYEQSKTEAHEVALQYLTGGLPLIITCPGHVLGPNDHSVFGYLLRMYLNKLMAPISFSPEMVIAPAHVEDIAEGIALAAEKGRLGETYILAGDALSLRELLDTWNQYPGGLKVRYYLPRSVASLLFLPLEPLQRRVGLPAFLSRETVTGSSASWNYSSAKAQRELGWMVRPSREMWDDIVAQELALLEARPQRDLVSRLRPVEMGLP